MERPRIEDFKEELKSLLEKFADVVLSFEERGQIIINKGEGFSSRSIKVKVSKDF